MAVLNPLDTLRLPFTATANVRHFARHKNKIIERIKLKCFTNTIYSNDRKRRSETLCLLTTVT